MKWISAEFPHLTDDVKSRFVAGTTTRIGGVSMPPFDDLNIATHVGDEPKAVYANRAILREQFDLPNEPYWLKQTHSNMVVELPYEYRPTLPTDASYTKLPRHICAAMTADCLPLLVVNNKGTEVAAIHAGWKGLANGIIKNTLSYFKAKPSELHVYLGPAIGPNQFEVGPELQRAFVDLDPNNSSCFTPIKNNQKYLANIYQLAQIQLQCLGVKHVSGGVHCTVTEDTQFYSYRRDGQTGRLVSLIWIK